MGVWVNSGPHEIRIVGVVGLRHGVVIGAALSDLVNGEYAFGAFAIVMSLRKAYSTITVEIGVLEVERPDERMQSAAASIFPLLTLRTRGAAVQFKYVSASAGRRPRSVPTTSRIFVGSLDVPPPTHVVEIADSEGNASKGEDWNRS